MRIFITKETSQSVIQFSGAVMSLSTKPIVAFTNHKITAKIKAQRYPSTSIPGTRSAATKTASADNKIEIINLIRKKVKKYWSNSISYNSYTQENTVHNGL